MKTQAELGVPREFSACHTAAAGGYWLEGHVPAESISALLKDAPEDVAGVAHLRAEIQSGDDVAWEVATYSADGRPISSKMQVEPAGDIDDQLEHDP
tara:strand:+ start:84 stop:374 length:291 start_codon:yes stop_codon:yes gene_type:complete